MSGVTKAFLSSSENSAVDKDALIIKVNTGEKTLESSKFIFKKLSTTKQRTAAVILSI